MYYLKMKKQKSDIKIEPTEKCILRVFVGKEPNEENATMYYDFPDKCKVFALVGILEAIKLELLESIEEIE